MQPNYDKRMKSSKEITPEQILARLPASPMVLALFFSLPVRDINTKLIQLKRQGQASVNKDGTMWYPIRMEKSIE